jgi:hypothetical protein
MERETGTPRPASLRVTVAGRSSGHPLCPEVAPWAVEPTNGGAAGARGLGMAACVRPGRLGPEWAALPGIGVSAVRLADRAGNDDYALHVVL